MPSLSKTLVLVLSLTLSSAPAWSQSGYDDIVDELTSRRSVTTSKVNQDDLLSDVNIYLGAGWVNSFFQPSDSKSKNVLWHSGVVLSLGIDLFSRHWMAEGSIKNYGSTKVDLDEYILKDFDLKLIHQSNPWAQLRSRWGIGLGGRFLEHRSLGESRSYSTPYATASAGLIGLISNHVQIGGEVAARTSLIKDTVDKLSFDAAIKLDTFF